MSSKSKNDNPLSGGGTSPGKIFIGGLTKGTTFAQYIKHFGKYGEIIDSVIMKDRYTGQPRGFVFITYADTSVVDKVIEEDHVINGKQVEIKRTIPKGSSQSKDFKTKKIFVSGIPSSTTEDEFWSFFSNYGKVIEHQIILDHATNRYPGKLSEIGHTFQGINMLKVSDHVIYPSGSNFRWRLIQVEIKKAEPKKASNPPPALTYGSNSRGHSYDDGFGGYGGSYRGFDGGFGPGPYRTPGSLGDRLSGGYGYGGGGGGGDGGGDGGGEFGGDYGGFKGSSLGGYRGESSLGYSSRFGHYDGGFGGGYGGSGVGGYGRGGDGYGSYAGTGYGGSYDSGSGASYGGAGGLYGRGSYSSSSRYHPYAR
ncbi:hypothetical protein CRYUN_Cryun39dG0005900 [Craigia yunnanensis]